MTKKDADVKRADFPNKGIRATWNPKLGTRFEIDPTEQQVRDNRGGPRLTPIRRKSNPGGEQTSWMK